MTTLSIRLVPQTCKGLLLLAILIASWLLARGPLVAHGQVANGIVLDLTVSLPLAYLFFLRGTRIPRLTVLPVLGFGLFFAAWLLPDGNVLLQTIRRFAVPTLEIGTLAMLGWTIWRARRTYRALAGEGFDLLERLRATLMREFPSPRLGQVLAFELAVLHYALLQWRRPQREDPGFTYHRRNAAPVVLGAVIFLVLSESLLLHFVVALWSPLFAWILTASSAYLGLQILAHLKAVLLRPIVLGPRELELRCGLLGDARISYEAIECIETWSQRFPGGEGELRVAPAGRLMDPNARVSLRSAQVWHGLYGFPRQARIIYLQVDEPEELVAAVSDRIWTSRSGAPLLTA